jgi:hypothetical protein
MNIPNGMPTIIVLTISILSRYIGLERDLDPPDTDEANSMLGDLYEKLTRFIQMNMRDEYEEDGSSASYMIMQSLTPHDRNPLILLSFLLLNISSLEVTYRELIINTDLWKNLVVSLRDVLDKRKTNWKLYAQV